MPEAAAARLAFYAAAGGPGVLAPRGWRCIALAGSNGSTLLVTPTPHRGPEFWSKKPFKTPEPAVEIAYRYGGTSGRWAVAQAIARYFPDRRAFIADSFQGLDVGPLPSGPYPNDRLRRTAHDLVEYDTPPGKQGAGTAGLLSPARTPVAGFVMLFHQDDGPDLLTVNVRLPEHDPKLARLILDQARSHPPG